MQRLFNVFKDTSFGVQDRSTTPVARELVGAEEVCRDNAGTSIQPLKRLDVNLPKQKENLCTAANAQNKSVNTIVPDTEARPGVMEEFRQKHSYITTLQEELVEHVIRGALGAVIQYNKELGQSDLVPKDVRDLLDPSILFVPDIARIVNAGIDRLLVRIAEKEGVLDELRNATEITTVADHNTSPDTTSSAPDATGTSILEELEDAVPHSGNATLLVAPLSANVDGSSSTLHTVAFESPTVPQAPIRRSGQSHCPAPKSSGCGEYLGNADPVLRQGTPEAPGNELASHTTNKSPSPDAALANEAVDIETDRQDGKTDQGSRGSGTGNCSMSNERRSDSSGDLGSNEMEGSEESPPKSSRSSKKRKTVVNSEDTWDRPSKTQRRPLSTSRNTHSFHVDDTAYTFRVDLDPFARQAKDEAGQFVPITLQSQTTPTSSKERSQSDIAVLAAARRVDQKEIENAKDYFFHSSAFLLSYWETLPADTYREVLHEMAAESSSCLAFIKNRERAIASRKKVGNKKQAATRGRNLSNLSSHKCQGRVRFTRKYLEDQIESEDEESNDEDQEDESDGDGDTEEGDNSA